MRRLELKPGFVALCSLACFLLPPEIFWPCVLLGSIHELGHLAALTACTVTVEGVRLGALGAVIETGPMGPWAELLCAMAGPAVNLFAFWALRRPWPRAALISLLIGACNLLPLYPLDGGRALRSALSLTLPLPAAMAAGSAVEALTLAALGLGALLLCGRFGMLPALLYFLLLANLAREGNFLLPSGRIPGIMNKNKTTRGKT